MTYSIHSNQEKFPVPNPKLVSSMKHYGETREEQININQKGLEILHKWREKEEKLSEDDLKSAEETWELVKQIIDENRSRKLLS
jgi:hypothetical protein